MAEAEALEQNPCWDNGLFKIAMGRPTPGMARPYHAARFRLRPAWRPPRRSGPPRPRFRRATEATIGVACRGGEPHNILRSRPWLQRILRRVQRTHSESRSRRGLVSVYEGQSLGEGARIGSQSWAGCVTEFYHGSHRFLRHRGRLPPAKRRPRPAAVCCARRGACRHSAQPWRGRRREWARESVGSVESQTHRGRERCARGDGVSHAPTLGGAEEKDGWAGALLTLEAGDAEGVNIGVNTKSVPVCKALA